MNATNLFLMLKLFAIVVNSFYYFSYSDEATTAIRADYGFLPAAYFLVAVYVIVTTSSFSFIEHKVSICKCFTIF